MHENGDKKNIGKKQKFEVLSKGKLKKNQGLKLHCNLAWAGRLHISLFITIQTWEREIVSKDDNLHRFSIWPNFLVLTFDLAYAPFYLFVPCTLMFSAIFLLVYRTNGFWKTGCHQEQVHLKILMKMENKIRRRLSSEWPTCLEDGFHYSKFWGGFQGRHQIAGELLSCEISRAWLRLIGMYALGNAT